MIEYIDKPALKKLISKNPEHIENISIIKFETGAVTLLSNIDIIEDKYRVNFMEFALEWKGCESILKELADVPGRYLGGISSSDFDTPSQAVDALAADPDFTIRAKRTNTDCKFISVTDDSLEELTRMLPHDIVCIYVSDAEYPIKSKKGKNNGKTAR